MKRGTIDHPKIKRLARLLGIHHLMAVGILEALWHWTARYAPAGDIGRYDNGDIADGIGYDEDADEFITALIKAGWLDELTSCRLYVHDWHDHADDAINLILARSTQYFANGKRPKLVRMEHTERSKIIEQYEAIESGKQKTPPAQEPIDDPQDDEQSAPMRTEAHAVRMDAPESALPLPKPKPLPKPMPEPVTTHTVIQPAQPVAEIEGSPAGAGGAPVDPPPKPVKSLEGFGEFWGIYPKKVGKGDAERAWAKIKPSLEKRAAIMAGLERWRASRQWSEDGGRYVPNPATWLHGKRWEDEPQTAGGGRVFSALRAGDAATAKKISTPTDVSDLSREELEHVPY